MGNGAHDEYMLGTYALDRLDPDETHRASEHLNDCGSCQNEYEQLIAARQSLGRIPSGWLVPGPPPGSAVLEAAMRTIRAHKAAAWARGRRAVRLAASIAGLAGMFSTGLLIGYQIQPAAAPPPPGPSVSPIPGVRQASALDPATNISLSATVTPAMGWVRVRAAVTGIPAGENCRLLVVRRDGTREIAGGWVTSKKGETEAVVLDGSAAVLPSEVDVILVENTAGRTFIAVSF
ncbi:MAG TPA: hypothetical protein VFC19_42180 [Candidatus Limnocylindrales bacterium]|nr:hypothetical protein [Candidatus Limnocylindrales bacterium]